jgi:hypothetical protein
MKKMLSILSGRLMSLIFPAALVASFLIPANVLAYVEMSNGNGGSGGWEGDPLDTNDYGSGGGGSDVHDTTSAELIRDPLIFELDKFQILLIPEFVGGTLIFRIMVIDIDAMGLTDLSLEGAHAP